MPGVGSKFYSGASVDKQKVRRGDTYIWTDFTLNVDDWFDSWSNGGSSDLLIPELVPIPPNGVYLGYHAGGVRWIPGQQIDDKAGDLANGTEADIVKESLTVSAGLIFTADITIASYFRFEKTGSVGDGYFGGKPKRPLKPLLVVNVMHEETGQQTSLAEVTILWRGYFEVTEIVTGRKYTPDEPLQMNYIAKYGIDPTTGCVRDEGERLGRERWMRCSDFVIVNPNNYIVYDA